MQTAGVEDGAGRQHRGQARIARGRQDRIDRVHLQYHVRVLAGLAEEAVDELTRAEFRRQQHERQLGELAHRQRFAAGLRTFGADHQHQLLLEQRLCHDLIVVAGGIGHRHVELGIDQLALHVQARHQPRDDVHTGVAQRELRHDRRQHRMREGMEHRHAQRAAHQTFQFGDGECARVDLLQDALAIGLEQPAGVGELDFLGATVEQHGADHLLQLLDLVRKRRLRDVQAFGRAREAARVGDGEKIAQMAQLHGSEDTWSRLGRASSSRPPPRRW